jgi:uncharacterized protein YggE
MNVRWKRLASIVLASLLSALSHDARGGEGGITVSGTGEVLAKPNRVEIDLAAGAAAELTGDAIVKYQNSLRRTLDAFQKMELKNLKIEQRSLSFESTGGVAAANAFVNAGEAPSAAKSQVDITRSLRVVLTETDQLSEQELMETIGRLLDAAKDAGAKVGNGGKNALLMRMMGEAASSTPVVTFVVEDAAAAREKAYQAAFDQAKARALRLAHLAGEQLGRVESVEEGVETPQDDSSVQERMITAIYGISSTSDQEESRLTSHKLAEIPVRVTLRVRFALAGAPNDKSP